MTTTGTLETLLKSFPDHTQLPELDGTFVKNFQEHPQSLLLTDGVISVAISRDSKTLVSVGWDKTIKIWNLQTGELKSTFTGHTEAVSSVTISPDGKTLVSGSWDKTIKVWRIPQGFEDFRFEVAALGWQCLAILDD
ncbi:hypothetical protein [Brasilonema sp. UFV-L1]|uniref:WD40 repeat domain-containing protein n=1 Tax=Brasilonema sp. UFV-L1 TaxID=2234130 RepID=UPI00145CAFE0|nr:hypothetical protein [Brasilonema sp. UFV-L1]NMG07779.1 hypothetical protein [Brasilonema sp. UFV-L1]